MDNKIALIDGEKYNNGGLIEIREVYRAGSDGYAFYTNPEMVTELQPDEIQGWGDYAYLYYAEGDFDTGSYYFLSVHELFA